MRIVVDTNVIASAIFFGGKPYQLLHYIMEGRVDVVASKEIVDEYEEIVLRLKQKYALRRAPDGAFSFSYTFLQIINLKVD